MTATALRPPPVATSVPCPDTLAEHAAVLMGDASSLAIADVAERIGVTAHTLRYYERIGLVTVPRDAAGRRRYTAPEITRVVFITRLRLTAMPIRDIHQYFQLVDQGPHTEPDRLAILVRHRAEVVERLAELQSALDVVDFKIGIYRDAAAA